MTDSASISIPATVWKAFRATDADGPIAHADELVRLGLYEGTEPSESEGVELTRPARHLLEGLLTAVGAVRVSIVDATGPYEATAWVAPNRVALVEQTLGERVALRRYDAGMLPLGLLELLAMGPRPSLLFDMPQTVPAQLLEDLLAGPEETSDRTHEPWEAFAAEIRPIWPEIHDAMADGSWRCWLLEALALEEDPPRRRGFACVLDTPAGMLGIELDGEEITLAPVTTTDVWLVLTTLFAPAT